MLIDTEEWRKSFNNRANKNTRTIYYPAIFHYENGGYWCEFPDLSGCFSQGDSVIDILENAKKTLVFYTKSILERGINIPNARSILEIKTNGEDFASYIVAEF